MRRRTPFSRAFGALDSFDETRPFAPWLKRIAANRAIDLLRRGQRLTALDHDVAWETVAPESREDLSAAVQAVAALDPQKRVVLVLRYWLDLSVEDIAGVLGVPVGTVASRLSRALSQLRHVLEEEHVA